MIRRWPSLAALLLAVWCADGKKGLMPLCLTGVLRKRFGSEFCCPKSCGGRCGEERCFDKAGLCCANARTQCKTPIQTRCSLGGVASDGAASRKASPRKPARAPPRVPSAAEIASCADRALPFVFVRGFHHTGTGLLRNLLALSPKARPLETGFFEDEGQHVQSQFPAISTRTPAVCGDELYRCAQDLADPDRTWGALCADWLPWIAPRGGAAFALEKTPDLSLPFLRATAGRCARPLVLLRHPNYWKFKGVVFARLGQSARCGHEASPRGGECALLWLEGAVRALGDLLTFETPWVVARYEAVATAPKAAARDLLEALGVSADDFPFGRIATHRRRLEFRGGEDGTADGMLTVGAGFLWGAAGATNRSAGVFDGSASCVAVEGAIDDAFGYDLAAPAASRLGGPVLAGSTDRDAAKALHRPLARLLGGRAPRACFALLAAAA